MNTEAQKGEFNSSKVSLLKVMKGGFEPWASGAKLKMAKQRVRRIWIPDSFAQHPHQPQTPTLDLVPSKIKALTCLSHCSGFLAADCDPGFYLVGCDTQERALGWAPNEGFRFKQCQVTSCVTLRKSNQFPELSFPNFERRNLHKISF